MNCPISALQIKPSYLDRSRRRNMRPLALSDLCKFPRYRSGSVRALSSDTRGVGKTSMGSKGTMFLKSINVLPKRF